MAAGSPTLSSPTVGSRATVAAPGVDAPDDRRARHKARTREALEAAAWRLFLRKGFEATTVEDITDAADVSPRTFFRYFPSKEAVLFAEKDRQLPRLREMLASRPAGEPPLAAIEASLVAFAEVLQAERERHVLRARLALEAPSVGDYSRMQLQCQYEEALVDALAARLGVDLATDPGGALRCRIVAGMAVAATGSAHQRWIAGDGRESLPALMAEAFAVVRQEAGAPVAQRPASGRSPKR